MCTLSSSQYWVKTECTQNTKYILCTSTKNHTNKKWKRNVHKPYTNQPTLISMKESRIMSSENWLLKYSAFRWFLQRSIRWRSRFNDIFILTRIHNFEKRWAKLSQLGKHPEPNLGWRWLLNHRQEGFRKVFLEIFCFLVIFQMSNSLINSFQLHLNPYKIHNLTRNEDDKEIDVQTCTYH